MKSKALYSRSLVWLRRDIRLEDNTALAQACRESQEVALVFVLDTVILNPLKSKSDRRVTFIVDSISELDEKLRAKGSQLIVRHGDPVVEIPKVAKELHIEAVFFNEDYEPYAQKRDQKIRIKLEQNNLKCFAFKDHVIFSKNDITKANGLPYKMFSPYQKAWLKNLKPSDCEKKSSQNQKFVPQRIVSHLSKNKALDLKSLGFERASFSFISQNPGRKSALNVLHTWSKNLQNYHKTRDYPEIPTGTSALSVHLRFGTISIRECVRICISSQSSGAKTWLSELIWRDFYQMILYHFPHVAEGAFKKEYNSIKWSRNLTHFQKWCSGETGFPIVDAGMRQLNETGFMHNRLRMITASFLVKDLLINWRWGEAYFAEKLLDFDLAANNGGWQWCASTGCDAQPYFRIFNPILQSQKFDPEAKFIKHWIPELSNLSPKEIHQLPIALPRRKNLEFHIGKDYPKCIVSHAQQKEKILNMYHAAKIKQKS